MFSHRRPQPSSSAPRRTRAGRTARTSRSQPARRARLLTRRAKLNAARRPRRGVLLLVVLSLLVLFMMVGTAFIITAKQSEKTAKTAMKASVRLAGEAAQTQLLDEVLLQVLRDTNNPHSSLRYHSLLGDMYGNDGLKGVITSTTVTGTPPTSNPTPPKFAGLTSAQTGIGPTAGQMIEIHIGTQVTTNDVLRLRDLYGNTVNAMGGPLEFAKVDNAYNGQVLTFIDGPAKGCSTRIVGFIPPNTFRVMNPRLENGGQLVEADLPNLDGKRVLINGRPFTGTGVGLNLFAANGSPKLTAQETVLGPDGTPFPAEISLLPNSRFFTTNPAMDVVSPSGALGNDYFPFGSQDWAGRGGANESYDAVDFQNMALAASPATTLVETYVNPTTLGDLAQPLPNSLDFTSPPPPQAPSSMVIPSWHRPDLLHYWANRGQFVDTGDLRTSKLARHAVALRKVLLRPNWIDHEFFTGSNPEFAAIPSGPTGYGQKLARMVHGPWDVDNDNDGIRDSVWVDVGLPVMAGPNGKLVKPLAAMLIVDMDGRLNVNAHGSNDLAGAWGVETGLESLATASGATKPLAGGATSNATPRGVGMGPADVSLFFSSGANSFQRMLRGETITINGTDVFFPGRYGHPDVSGMIRPGFANRVDLMSLVGMNGWPRRSAALSIFAGSTPDMRARYGVGLDVYGLPVFDATLNEAVMASAYDDLAIDSPYELNLSQTTAAGVLHTSPTEMASDAPFTVAELERVLRVYDSDSGALPKRLSYLSGIMRPNAAGQDGIGPQFFSRTELTTDSYDLPIPDVSIPGFLQGLVSTDAAYRRMPKSAADVLEMRIRQALFPVKFLPTGAIDPTTLPANLNRRFPNPLNDADARLVRGHLRQLLAPDLANGTRLNVNRAFGNGRDDNNNGVIDEPGEFIDYNGNGVYDPGLTTPDRPEETLVWPFSTDSSGHGVADNQYGAALFPVMATEVVPDPAYPNGRIKEIDHRQLMARHLYVTALMLATDANFGLSAPNTAEGKADRILARRIAQWAVNIIDFRDPDNIMTAFEYDVNPFDGWGDPNPANPHHIIDGIPDETYPPDGNVHLVWGTERPELLITETAAWHDRRTDDSASEDPYPATDKHSELDPTDPDNDQDYDQITRPRGALFIELYNPWPSAPGASADTHAIGPGPNALISRVDRGVDLTKRASDGSPAWRMTMYKRGQIADIDAAQWDPDSPDVAKRPSVPADRTVYFTGAKPPARYPVTGIYSGGAPFFNHANNPVPAVRPGRYMVVGAGEDMGNGLYRSVIGDVKGSRNPNNPASQRPKRRIELSTRNIADKVRFVDANNNVIQDSTVEPNGSTFALESPRDPGRTSIDDLAFVGDDSESVTDVALINQSVDSAGNQEERLLTISEPAEGYPDSFQGVVWDATKQQYEVNGVMTALDIPLDGPIGGGARLDATLRGTPRPSYLTNIDPVLTQIRAQGADDAGASYSQIYLQRLANPLLPWNPPKGTAPNGHNPSLPVNPYLTVDSSSVNLTVFNSRGNDAGEEEDGTTANSPRDRFASHERGYTTEIQRSVTPANISNNDVMPSLWAEELPSGERDRNGARGLELKATPQNRFFPSGGAGTTRLSLVNSNDYWFQSIPFSTLGFANRSFHNQALAGDQRKLVPQKPYEWANWNNRPFNSGNELVFVPRLRSSELLRRFSSADGGTAPPEPYLKPTGEIDPASGNPRLDPQPAFAHLENFFYSDSATTVRTVPREMHRVLDFIHTPSLFAGTDTWLNPSLTADPTGLPDGRGFGWNVPSGQLLKNMEEDAGQFLRVAGFPTDPRLDLRPPFNTVSEFREPGRVNLNTLSVHPRARNEVSDVWRGIFHGDTNTPASHVHFAKPIDDFMKSRRGDTGSSPLTLNADLPTFIANPFRDAGAGDAVPIADMYRNAIQVGLLRTSVPNQSEPVADSKPLFANESIGNANAYRDTSRNAYFRYQPINRLDNLTTTRSNVYAVWITIGFFEVDDAPEYSEFLTNNNNLPDSPTAQALYKQVYPDGYQFTREDGVDVGNIRRLRSFYIIDRTLPAGYEPGADHNVDETIRLRRRIE